LDLEVQYWALLANGIGTVEACRTLGISRCSGRRWRVEAAGLGRSRSSEVAEAEHSSRWLSRLERQRIASLRRDGCGVREIARQLGRAPSTISRELNRNTARRDRCYDGDLAHSRARQRARRPRLTRIAADEQLCELVQSLLELEWSPEQIAGHLRLSYPDRPWWHVCHETIYQALYRGGRGGLSRALTAKLRTGRGLRHRRRRPDQRSARYVAPARLIDQRPAAAADRGRLGDWEGDLIVGPRNRSAIGTLVDRRSRLLRLVHLPHGHTAAACRAAIELVMASVPPSVRLTLTWDQGTEMAEHHLLAAQFAEGIYFAHPGSPWMRGSNENTNGLLRQYFPKKTDLNTITIDDLQRVEDRLNHRPRKMFGWRTPSQIYSDNLVTP
jgi:IS30 family transposase